MKNGGAYCKYGYEPGAEPCRRTDCVICRGAIVIERIRQGSVGFVSTPDRPPCIHLGLATGDHDYCTGCLGKRTELPTFRCAVHGECSPDPKLTAATVKSCRDCKEYDPGIVIDQGAGGIGDGLQGLGAALALASETGGRLVYNCGQNAQQALSLFDTPNVALGVCKHDCEDTGRKECRQMNLFYKRECAEKGKAESRAKRYSRNVGAKGWRFAALKEPDRIREIGREYQGAVVLCPWSTEWRRNWHVEHWLHVERLLLAEGFEAVISHAKSMPGIERFQGRKVIGGHIERLAGLMLNAAAVVCVDSGPAHLAGMLRIPTTVLGGWTQVAPVFACYPTLGTIQGTAPNDGRDGITGISPREIVDRVKAAWLPDVRSLVSADRRVVIRNEALRTNGLAGDVAEFGVYKGGTAKLIGHVANPGTRLHLFDTFEGIPETDQLPGGHVRGDFGDTDLESVRSYVGNPNAWYHVGRFPRTAPLDLRYRFVHVDADTYQSTTAAVAYFAPRMAPGGAMVFDDYEWPQCPGVAKSLHERLPGRVERGALYQAVVRF